VVEVQEAKRDWVIEQLAGVLPANVTLERSVVYVDGSKEFGVRVGVPLSLPEPGGSTRHRTLWTEPDVDLFIRVELLGSDDEHDELDRILEGLRSEVQS
jgi:hypothetical protein